MTSPGRVAFAVAALTAAIAAQGAGAGTAFSGNACRLLSAKQVAAFGIQTQCSPTTRQGPGFTTSSAAWNLQATGAQPHLSISINTYASKSGALWQLAMKSIKTLPGAAKKVSGIGSIAYESGSDGSALSVINFVVGNQVVNINMRTTKAPSTLTTFNALATSVAAKL
jgi:hypothetical protein